jgi:hypothetical protein
VRVPLADFSSRQAAEINLRQICEMGDELRNPGSTKWGTPDSQTHYKSAQARITQLEDLPRNNDKKEDK